MIYSSIEAKFDLDLYPKVISDAVKFLKNTDFSTYEQGEYEIDGRNLLFQVHDIVTKPLAEGKPEVHRKYIDIQFIFKGNECIGFINDTGNNGISQDLLESRDLMFYKPIDNMTILMMKEGDFAVFFPTDVHMPGCTIGESSKVRKIVYKVNVDLLISN